MASQVKTGKAFEYSLLKSFERVLTGYGQKVQIINNLPFRTAYGYHEEFSDKDKLKFNLASEKAVEFFPLVEPILLYKNPADPVLLSLASDSAGQKGDVRDILISRDIMGWEIGISAKHNHRAVKHPRLSQTIDFGKSWLNLPASTTYFNEIAPVFSKLKEIRAGSTGVEWSDLDRVHETVYYPVLTAFRKELLRLDQSFPSLVPLRLIQYLLGRQDFYKVIRSKGIIEIQGFNLHGTLNQTVGKQKTRSKINKLKLPDRIIDLSFKANSLSTLELVLNEGWQITFRIHNASSKVEPSLKFDINLISVPQTLFTTQFHI